MSTMTRRLSVRRDERGTSLILALVFVFAIGLVLVAVGGLAANALLNTSNARAERTSTGDAENAVTIAMQYLRYNPAPAAPPSCLPPSSTIPSSDPGVTAHNPVQVQVDCIVTTTSTGRLVEFYACPLGASTEPACQTAALLHAEVAYDDRNAQDSNNIDCYDQPLAVTTSCGTAVNVDLWDVIGADS